MPDEHLEAPALVELRIGQTMSVWHRVLVMGETMTFETMITVAEVQEGAEAGVGVVKLIIEQRETSSENEQEMP